MKHVIVTVKIIAFTKNENPSPCICENGKYFKSIAGTSVIVCDEIVNATDRILYQQIWQIKYQQIS